MIYLRKLRSVNYEISTRQDATDKVKTKTELISFFVRLKGEFTSGATRARIIKARYWPACRPHKNYHRLIQTYFGSAQEFWQAMKG